MANLPDGVITFLMTDVEGSTRMWEEAPESMMRALDQHDVAIDEAVTTHRGVSVKPRGEGDSRFIVFRSAVDALTAATEVQQRLAAVDWATPRPLRVRTSLHTGAADLQLGDYYGSTVNRAARLRAIAHGGQTVMSRSTWELVQDRLPEGVTVRDMGEHGLKDLTRPEHVFQVDVAGLQDAFPPLASLDTVPNNLPEQLTDFVGRRHELAEATRLVGTTRLLTILAPGGTGKTRLAIQAAADVTGEYPDGVFFIGLADLSSSSDIVQSVAESLGVALLSDEDVQVQLLTHLAGKRQLLVFDNFEHLTGSVPIISEILTAAPHVTVVATSRAKLNLTGETVLTLSGLETTWERPEEAIQASGVQLFIDAAKRSNPGFVLEPDDLDALAEILRLTGGMPLAIVLAAAWADMLPIAEIASEIADNIDFLETEMGDVPDRHRSIRAVFDYSWELLSPAEREIFAALSVFRGGFSREAAQAVAGASLRDLANLASKSLLIPSPRRGRYAVHEMLRQYAAAELEKDRDRCDQALEAHAAFYAALTEEAASLVTKADQPKTLAMVEGDIDNIRAAWRFYLATGNAAAGRRFVAGLYFVYEWRGWYPAAVSLFGEALETIDAASHDEDLVRLRALAAAVQAWFLTLLGQPVVGAAAAAAAIESLPAGTDPVDRWVAVQCLALGLVYLSSVEEMTRAVDDAIADCENLEDPFFVAGLKNWRAFAAIAGGDIDTASALAPQGMELFEQRNDHYFMVWNLWLQAIIATQEQRPHDAIALLTRQVERGREITYVRGTIVSLEALGEAHVTAGSLEGAESAFLEGMAAARQMGMVQDLLSMMTKVARVQASMGLRLEAVELLATVLAEGISARMPFTDNTPIDEMASAALDGLEKELDPDEYAAAYARGTARPYEVAAKELLDPLTGSGGAPGG